MRILRRRDIDAEMTLFRTTETMRTQTELGVTTGDSLEVQNMGRVNHLGLENQENHLGLTEYDKRT